MRCHGRLKGFGRFCYTWQNQESVTRRESSCEVTANHPGDTFHLAGASLHEVANVSGAQAAEAALGAGEVADLLSGFAQVLHHYYDGSLARSLPTPTIATRRSSTPTGLMTGSVQHRQ